MSRPSDHAAELRCAGCSRADRYAAAVMLDLFDKVYEALPPCERGCNNGVEMTWIQPTATERGHRGPDVPCPSCVATDFIGKMDPAEFIDRLLAMWADVKSAEEVSALLAAHVRQAGQQ